MTAGAGEGAPAPAGRRATFGKGAKWFAGIVVVAVVGALVPIVIGRFTPPAALRVELSKLSIDEHVSLDDYRFGNSPVLSFGSGYQPRLRLASYEVAEAGSTGDEATGGGDGTATGDGATKAGGDDTKTDADAKTTDADATTTDADATKTDADATTTEGDGTKTDATTTDADGTKTDETDPGAEQPGDENGPPVLRPDLSGADKQELQKGLARALSAPSTAEVTVPESCQDDLGDEECGLRSLQRQLGVSDPTAAGQDISTEVVAQRLLQVFKGTRTRPSLDDPGKRELVGVRVNFNVAMTGFRGRLADIRWTLVSRGTSSRVPRPWLRRQHVTVFEGEADEDSGSGEFWVPIPKARGPFVIRVEAFNDRRTRLDYIDSKRFN